MKISTEQAVVKTAQVEIKTLSVAGKQVTLAVFRQLDRKAIIDQERRKLNGIPWGRINYHPDKCDKSDEHLHLVWQDGNNLYADVVRSSCRPQTSGLEDLGLRRSVLLEPCGMLINKLGAACIGETGISLNYEYFRNWEPGDGLVKEWMEKGWVKIITEQGVFRFQRHQFTAEGVKEFQSMWAAQMEVKARIDRELKEIKSFHAECYRHFLALDLLFIAV